MSRDFLQISDLDHSDLTQVLQLSASAKSDPDRYSGKLSGKTIGLFFEKPSTRTRVSCEVAAVDLGAYPLVLRQEEVGLGTREPVKDAARVLTRYLDILAFRVFSHSHLETLAAYSEAPVVNLLSDRGHPCQALADLQTIAEHRELPGTRLVFVGDGNNVANSLLVAGAMTGMEVVISSPEGYEPQSSVVSLATELAASGGSVTVTEDPRTAIEGADVVYTDVWSSMGDEKDAERRRSDFMRYQIDEELFNLASRDAIFLHCLPAHRGEEVVDQVIEHDRSLVWDQAENRLHSFKALLLYIAGVT